MAMLNSISEEVYWDGTLVLCPPLAIEIISAKQRVMLQNKKIGKWLGYDVPMGGLNDRERGKVWICPAGQPQSEEPDMPESLPGQDVRKRFRLDCIPIWS